MVDNIIRSSILPGIPLTTYLFYSLEEEKQERIMESVGQFLATLHSLTSHKIQQIKSDSLISLERGFLKASKCTEMINLKDFSKLVLKLFLNVDDSNFTDATHFFISQVSNLDKCLCHGDLHLGNILYDSSNEKISVVDFIGISQSSPAVDFIDLKENLSELSFNKLLEYYNKTSRQKISKQEIEDLKSILDSE